MSPSAPEAAVFSAFEKRAERAEALAGASRVAAEPLRFAVGLYRVQGELAGAIARGHATRPLCGRLSEDVDAFLDELPKLLAFAAEHGPSVLAEEARTRRLEDRSLARERLLVWWQGDRSTTDDYLSRALLRPYAEVLSHFGLPPGRRQRQGACPFCGGLPWIASRRAVPEADGAQRSLGCALCGREWPFARICCPSCSEQDPEKLPSFQSDTLSSVRIEACETCHRYVKSIDMTNDARPIPEVDDLSSIGMDLWAVEQGLVRIEPGLAGV